MVLFYVNERNDILADDANAIDDVDGKFREARAHDFECIYGESAQFDFRLDQLHSG